jgi:SAM-dependent methyltransferase
MTLDDALYLAPITAPESILDIGTGTGIWATDMADKFPAATITGTDLSPHQPGMQPDNCRFEVDDCCSAWVYDAAAFDFIHLRGLFGSISDWPALYRQIFHHLRPGGYVEHVEWSIRNRAAVDGRPLGPDEVLGRWSRNALECAARTGKSFAIAEEMAGLVADAGFEHVVERRFKWPIGPWSSDPKLKEIGRWNLLNWEEGMEGWVMAPYTRVLGVNLWSFLLVSRFLFLVLFLLFCSSSCCPLPFPFSHTPK